MENQITYSSLVHEKRRSLPPMKRILLVSVIIVILAGVSVGYYLFNKPHQSISDEAPAFKLDAPALVKEFDENEKLANSKYLGKIVQVKGIIAEKSKDNKGGFNITLQGPDLAGIGCQFEPKAFDYVAKLKEGQEVCIKGICSGVLMDVVMVDCCIVPNIPSK